MTFFFSVIKFLCDLLSLAIVARALMSWFSPGPTNAVAVILYRVTEPILSPLRRIVPRAGMIDFTPLIAIILLQLIAYLLP